MKLATINRLAIWLLILACVCGSSGTWGFCAIPEQAAQEASPCANGKEIPEGRLAIIPLKQPLKLEEANEIRISVHGYNVHSANVSWSYYTVNGDLWSPDARMNVTVMYHADGSPYVRIVPEKLGKLRLALSACFDDGGSAVDSVDAEVVLPERKPEKLLVAKSGTG